MDIGVNYSTPNQKYIDLVGNITFSRYDFRDMFNLNQTVSFQQNESLLNSDNLFTIVIPTFQRNKLVRKSIQHYASYKNVSRLIIVWFNEDEMPDSREISKFVNKSIKLKLDFYWMPNFVRLRYFPYPSIQTECVLNVDDDILIAEKSALKAFKHWKEHPSFMYGFVARSHNVIGRNLYEYVMEESTHYSFLLANNIFLHRNYYVAYQDYIKQWEKVIDRWQACEDIAMSFMIADLNRGQSCAFKVKGSYKDTRDLIKTYKGLSKRRGHHFQRSYCMNRYAERYDEYPLVKHDIIL